MKREEGESENTAWSYLERRKTQEGSKSEMNRAEMIGAPARVVEIGGNLKKAVVKRRARGARRESNV